MSELYKGMAGSPITYLASDISAGQTTISVADDTALPDAPNICTIGYGEEIETIKYGTKSNGVLQNVTRGIEGAPRAWQVGTEVARFFTAYDHDAIAEVLSKNPVWFSEFEEALINSVSTKILKNLFGNGSKIHASEIITGTQANYKTVEDHITDNANKNIVTFDRTANSIGVQSVDLGFKPRIVHAIATVAGGSNGGYRSDGVSIGTVQRTVYRAASSGIMVHSAVATIFLHSGAAEFRGSITFTATGVNITWSKTGDIVAGTVNILLVAE